VNHYLNIETIVNRQISTIKSHICHVKSALINWWTNQSKMLVCWSLLRPSCKTIIRC
jgi:hypothetical protein